MTPEQIKEAKFRGPVRFYDGVGGMARQDFECINEPRLTYAWQRKDRSDQGRQFYLVDGIEVADLDEAAKLLAKPPAKQSPRELEQQAWDAMRFSPRINMATRALSEARCNADVGPMASVRAWLARSESPWHGGINKYADGLREEGADWPSWLYNCKTAAHEAYRSMYLFAADRKTDTGLRCSLGVTCRECPILQSIDSEMTASTKREKFSYDLDEQDIDAAKAWTCIGHILQSDPKFLDGAMFSTAEERKNPIW